MHKPIEILLVEDNPVDVRLTQEALKEVKISHHLHVARDGEEALEFLLRQGPHTAAVRPDIVFLDLNLPRIDGREVLDRIKQHKDLRRIPIVVLTTSGDECDIRKSYDLNANCYIRKPVDMQHFVDVIKAIHHFWFSIVTLPSEQV